MTTIQTKIVSRLKFLKSNSLSNYFLKEPIYIFHHIPKCGGTSLVYGLREWFNIVKDYKTTHTSKKISKPKNLNNFRHFQCLSGHFHFPGLYLHERYPEALTNNRFKIFTLLRDPFETKISLYYYQRRTKTQPREMSLEEHLLSEPNWMAGRFPCTKENYKEILARYFFIGILEYPQESIDRLAKLIGKELIKLPFENNTKRDSQIAKIDNRIKEKFMELNDLDYMIYRYCYEKFISERTPR